MELTSVPLHKGQVSWRGLLLTVSLVIYWNSPTAAQDITLEAVPSVVAVGGSVYLLAHNVPRSIRFFTCKEPLPKPSITTNNANSMEGEDSVALMCEPKTQNTAYLWRINDQSLSVENRLKLSEDNRTLTLLSVVRTDTGLYECESGT
ncbi:carcinoembryonic antigen-related cell adhesion molecule 8-like, partial [Onychomys torridus]|uniref:carcinoembryonic antigen-related cell adhesion molecule 8-like n=1 Tax=Onychomys torridus TaxID=38674 RepID=UPI00167F4235